MSALGKAYTLIAVSNSTREFLSYLLSGIEPCFARVFSSVSDYGQLKTPDFYLKVCREMDVLPNQISHSGDSWQFDFLAPKEAGVEAFHLDTSEEEKGKGKKGSLSSLTELRARLLTA